MQKQNRVSPRNWIVFCALASPALALVSGCGSSGQVIVQLEGTSASVSKVMLAHWMRATVGSDFWTSVGTRGPLGLVAEPANYSECASAAKKIVPRTQTGQLNLSDAEIKRKCRALYEGVKAQALGFLISAKWEIVEGAQQGIRVSDALLHREFERFRRETYPTKDALHKYLSERHLELSDMLYQLKRNILVGRLLPGFKAKVERAGGGERIYTKLALQRYRARVARTNCKRGYVVPGCRQYNPQREPPAPNVILEQFVTARAS